MSKNPSHPSSTTRPTSTSWETHRAPDGRTYYYDPVTKRSTYEKPEEMMSVMERAEASTRWRRFETPAESDGKPGREYWAHQGTGETTWEVPRAIVEVREAVRRAEQKKASGGGERGAKSEPGRTDEESLTIVRPTYASVEEAKEAFKKMLADHGVRGSTKWEEVVNRCKADARFGALGSTGEKKQCLNEYQQARAKMEREARRIAEKKAREALRTLLEERRERLGLTSSSRLTRDGPIEEALRDDPRWRAITDARERADIFEDFTRDLRIREQRERERSKTNRAQSFKECLLEAGATAESLWRKIRGVVQHDERYTSCEPVERLEVFEKLLRELQVKEEAKVEAERAATARSERKRREAFVELLNEAKSDGVIEPRMPWKSFVPRIENDQRYTNACENIDGSRPRELYEDVIDEIEDEIDQKLDDFEDLLREGYKARELFGNTTWEKAEKLYRHDKAWKEAPKEEAKKLFVKFIAKVFRREQEKERLRREERDGRNERDERSLKKSRRDRSRSRY
ncbi:Pre-mRNA-processing protein PRP40 [Ostreococcus tauri]|uniref:Pre-mRNA-processing protein PRP40 n=2 Tax=Ostreococcus tauri TaxID=70448 RepID=A0A096P9U5_OSTTA|nr:Pre-mRNA-processing protein PRP40 [Ostreococcus tauri]CEG01707.1 Pre-mRNA-processing protein PRP40 [Ostreococcus tauri]|eukprot:XP_022841118.1 Pre-mRNA-processing protein PRP40 [Ostreococcus tauri]